MSSEPIPEISNPDLTTQSRYGGDVMLNIRSLLSDIDLSPLFDGWRPKFRTQLLFRSGTIAMLDTDSSNEVHIVVDDIDNVDGNVNLHIPAFVDTDDTMLLQNHPQTINYKVFGTSITVADDIEFNSNAILHAAISGEDNTLSNIADTALLQITDKGKQHTQTAYKDGANIFTAIQKIQVDNGQQFTFYRPVSTVANGAGFYYDFNDSLNAEHTYGFQYVSIEDNVESTLRGDFNIQLAINNTLGLRFRVFTSGSGGIIFGNNQRILMTGTGLSAQRTFTFPDASGRLVIQELTNTFTNFQKISNDASTNIILARPNNTVGNLNGIIFDALDSASTEITYAAIYQAITTNTAGVPSGDLSFRTILGGAFAERMRLVGNTLKLGSSNQVTLDPTGTAARTMTYPNTTTQLIGTNDVAVVTKKSIDQKDNVILREARKGRYSPSTDTGVYGEGSLRGLIGLGTRGTSTVNTGGRYDIWNTRAVANDCAGVIKLDDFTCQRLSNSLIRFAFLYGGSTTNRRVFKGLGSKRLINTDSDTAPLNSAEPGIFFGYGVGDTEWQIFHNDSSGTCVKETTGITIPVVSTNYIVEIQAVDATPSFIVTFYSVVSPGSRGSVIGTAKTISADIPAQTTPLYLQDLAVTTNASVQANNIHYVEVFA